VRFAITDRFFVDDGKNSEKTVLASGGSTTECGLIPESQRWPDLLQQPAYNYGVSGNTSIDGYYNLKFLIENHIVKPSHVFIMYAVNDLRAFLNKGADKFRLRNWNRTSIKLGNLLESIDEANKKVLWDFRIRDSALLSFLHYSNANFRGRTFYAHHLLQRQQQDKMETIKRATIFAKACFGHPSPSKRQKSRGNQCLRRPDTSCVRVTIASSMLTP
jgi:hypothetical protein